MKHMVRKIFYFNRLNMNNIFQQTKLQHKSISVYLSRTRVLEESVNPKLLSFRAISFYKNCVYFSLSLTEESLTLLFQLAYISHRAGIGGCNQMSSIGAAQSNSLPHQREREISPSQTQYLRLPLAITQPVTSPQLNRPASSMLLHTSPTRG